MRSECIRAGLAGAPASGKNPREGTKKRRRTKNPWWIRAARPTPLLSSRPGGTARGGNCVKVDVGYAKAAPSVRGIINSRRRAVTKVRARRLVSRSVSGRVDLLLPLPFLAHPSELPPSSSFRSFSCHPRGRVDGRARLSPENPRIDSSAIIHRRPRRPSSASITAHFFLFHLPAAHQ